MPIGRGGQGNILAAESERQHAAQDVEAQRQTVDQAVAQTLAGDGNPSEYAYIGRGGQGNVFNPRELETTGTFTSTSVTDYTQISSPMQQIQDAGGRRPSVVSVQQSTVNPTIRRVGRGGAGNYEYSQANAKSKELELQEREQSIREEIQSAVEQSIDDHLAMPPKARIATAGVYRG